MTTPAAILDRLAAQAGQLYSLPAVAMQVLKLTDDPQMDTRTLRECIENDPALTVKILRVVNSSLFGLTREVSDLGQALTLLGTKPLKLLVLGFSLPGGLLVGMEARTLGWYWRHTLTKAVAGREISERLWKVPGDDVFVAGLLQDLGILVLLQQIGQPYARFLNRMLSRNLDVAEMETQAIGFPHTTLSARMLNQWGLPAALVEAIDWRPPELTDPVETAEEAAELDDWAGPWPPVPQMLHLAELLARLVADGQRQALVPLLRAARRYRHLSVADLETLVADLQGKVQQLADVLSLHLPAGLEYRDVLVEAHRRLSQVADEAAEELLHGKPGRTAPSGEVPLDALQELAAAFSLLCPATAEPPGAEHASAAVAPTPVRSASPVEPQHQRVVKADAHLLRRLDELVADCRQSHRPFSLLLAELTRGVDAGAGLLEVLKAACGQVDHPGVVCTAYGQTGLALLLPDCERSVAVRWGNQLLRTIRGPSPSEGLGVGVATVAAARKNFSPQDLLHGAERCLYGAHLSAGSVVKSIEIY
ncbi:MAG: HDOD domain-containing protein [Thermoguttaceae bacterium]|jgi:HD-like signal output (HDOD) protein/GGDEF domain-containing protein